MLAIRATGAFDGERMAPGGATVFIEEGRIVGIESAAASAMVPDGCPLVDFGDATVLPGLIEVHTHLCGDGHDGALDRLAEYSDAELDAVIEQSLRRQLAAGVTTVRDVGDRRWAVLSWRDRVKGGALNFACPTITASGPPITTRAGHCWNMGGEVDGADDLRTAVRERAERGVDVVKIMASGGALTLGTDMALGQFSLDQMRLVVDEAHRSGLPVTAHAHALRSVEAAVEAGVDGIEHCTCLTQTGVEISDQLLESLAASQIAVCPTLGKTDDAVPPPRMAALMERFGLTWEARLVDMGRMYRAGVRLVSGADSGISKGKPHGILPRAIADLVDSGMPAGEALASATSLAAHVCGLPERKGRLRVGHDADLLVVDGDPVADISSLSRVVAVMANGVLV